MDINICNFIIIFLVFLFLLLNIYIIINVVLDLWFVKYDSVGLL